MTVKTVLYTHMVFTSEIVCCLGDCKTSDVGLR